VVATLQGAGYRWYETANFCRQGRRDLRSRHNLGYWLAHDYLGVGVGAVSTIGLERWRNAPSLKGYMTALAAGRRPPREPEALGAALREMERVMLGLRLDQPLPLAEIEDVLDPAGLRRVEQLGLVRQDGRLLELTDRGRFLGDAVTAALLT